MSDVMDAGSTFSPGAGEGVFAQSLFGGYALFGDGSGPRANAGSSGDAAEFSEEAMKRFKESALRPLVKRAMSLEVIEERINAVKAEIEAVWNSALPDDEKVRQVSCKKNEISLLQAGQYEFVKSGFSRAA